VAWLLSAKNWQSGEPLGRSAQARVENCLAGSRVPCGDIARRCERNGRCIRHAPLGTAFPIGALTVAVIETALRAVLMTAIGGSPLFALCWNATFRTAITLTAITGATNEEDRVASAAYPLPKDNFVLFPHPRCQVGLDKDDGSWQGKTIRCLI
jgi:hypothetical protein